MQLPWSDVERRSGLVVVIVSGACCVPGMAPFDEQAKRIVEQAIAETRISAEVKLLPATKAFLGGIPRKVMMQLMAASQRGEMPVPAVLINGSPISFGVPKLEQVKTALLAVIEQNVTGADR